MPNNINLTKKVLLLVLPVKNKLHERNKVISTRKARMRPLFSSSLMLPCGRKLVTEIPLYIPSHVSCLYVSLQFL